MARDPRSRCVVYGMKAWAPTTPDLICSGGDVGIANLTGMDPGKGRAMGRYAPAFRAAACPAPCSRSTAPRRSCASRWV